MSPVATGEVELIIKARYEILNFLALDLGRQVAKHQRAAGQHSLLFHQ